MGQVIGWLVGKGHRVRQSIYLSRIFIGLVTLMLVSLNRADADPSLAFTGSPAPDTVKIGDDITFRVAGTVNDPPKGDAECTITGPDWKWTVSNKDKGSSVKVAPTTGAATVDVTSNFTTAGTYSIEVSATATYHTVCGADTPVTGKQTYTVYAIGGDFIDGNKNLHYYCGVPDDEPPLCSALQPQQPPGTTHQWTTSPDMHAEDKDFYAIITGVAATPKDQGKGTEWVQLTYSRNGVTATSKHLGYTVQQPASVAVTSSGPDPDPNQQPAQGYEGFATLVTFTVHDQFGADMGNVPRNEKFGDWTDVIAPNNWGYPKPVGGYDPPPADHISIKRKIDDPNPLNPPLTKPPTLPQVVKWAPQDIYAGSTNTGEGCKVDSHFQVFYTDHAAWSKTAPK